MQIQRVLETCLCVTDLVVAEAFYREVLGLKLHAREAGRHVFFRCGRAMFLLFDARATQIVDGRLPTHGTAGPGHVAFAVAEADLRAWAKRLPKLGVRIEAVIDWPGGGRSLYFRDPSGNSVERATPKIWGLKDVGAAKLPQKRRAKPAKASRVKAGKKQIASRRTT